MCLYVHIYVSDMSYTYIFIYSVLNYLDILVHVPYYFSFLFIVE